MSEQRTEEPTLKRLRDARKKGDVPKSRDLPAAALVLAAAAGLMMTGSVILASLQEIVETCLKAAAHPGSAKEVLEASFAKAFVATVPLLGILVATAALAHFVQVGPLLTWHPLLPRFSRLDIRQGLAHLFSKRKAVELVQSIVKIGIIGIVGFTTLKDRLHEVASLALSSPRIVLSVAAALATAVLVKSGAALMGLSIVDLVYQRIRYHREKRMTKEEVRREHKESEGDPQTKRERERLHKDIVAHSMLESVRQADVLVVIPGRLAIALQYDRGSERAPIVTSKGQDELARRMIEAAQKMTVPVIRDMSVAPALSQVQLGAEIPEALYEPVAILLRSAWNERGGDAQEHKSTSEDR